MGDRRCDGGGLFLGSNMADFRNSGAFDVDMSVDYKDVVLMLDRLVYSKMVEANDVRKLFRIVMAPVRKSVQQSARQAIPNDPRDSYKGMRVITLKKGAGAVFGLLNPFSSAKSMYLYRKPRGGKSGIIRNREKSDRTKQVEGYYGKDRAWILRILNQGTVNGPRKAGTRGTLKKEANRGTITAKKFFNAAAPAMKQAEKALAVELGKLIEKESKKG